MNERIEKLIEQCTVQEFSDCTGGFETFDKEKFAQLIVAECLVVINQSNGVGDDDVIKISKDVEKHFGVEE